MVKSKTVLNKIRSVVDDHPGLKPKQWRYISQRIREEYDLVIPQRNDNTLPEYLEPSEVRDFYEAARELNEEKKTDKYMVVAKLGINTGLRVSEMIDLDVRDIKPKEGHVIVRQGKGDKDRTTFIDDETINLINSYTGYKEKGYVFDVTVRSIQNWVREIRNRYNERQDQEKDITPHTLRHTFATVCMHKGMSLKELATLMGHNSTETTEKYGRLTPNPGMKQKYNKVI